MEEEIIKENSQDPNAIGYNKGVCLNERNENEVVTTRALFSIQALRIKSTNQAIQATQLQEN